ncbi:hypothetical protein OC846_003680 [Tilletia horrida]|uniref:Uncharacterized protein n=1 Tax=Tilletia horrida TaxID=155126 RepID=A0AAN6JRJ2_9BASI|nr:hypothetical protein OC846_003680 [Tilletia horrida]KAK0565553.1 hypothetical protein OC861_003715 [Tilletia horrida]
MSSAAPSTARNSAASSSSSSQQQRRIAAVAVAAYVNPPPPPSASQASLAPPPSASRRSVSPGELKRPLSPPPSSSNRNSQHQRSSSLHSQHSHRQRTSHGHSSHHYHPYASSSSSSSSSVLSHSSAYNSAHHGHDYRSSINHHSHSSTAPSSSSHAYIYHPLTSASSSSSSFSLSSGSSSRSHPSPATSISSASTSSLRTPPDLHLNPSISVVGVTGSTVLLNPAAAVGLLEKDKQYQLLHPNQQSKPSKPAARTLSMDAIKERLKLIDSLGQGQGANIRDSLPRAPHGRNGAKISPEIKLSGEAKPTLNHIASSGSLTAKTEPSMKSGIKTGSSNRPRPSPDRLRKHESYDDSAASVRKRKSQREESDSESAHVVKKSKSSTSSSASSLSRSISRTPPAQEADLLPIKEWTVESLQKAAKAFKERGRKLKHAGDARVRSNTSSSPQVNARTGRTGKQEASEIAALEHMDAILHFVYSFWCEDQAHALKARNGTPSSVTSNPNNWASLFPFLEFTAKFHPRVGWTHLAGFTKLVEAMIRQLLVSHEQRQTNSRIAKLNANARVNLTAVLEGKAGNDVDMEDEAPPTPGGPETQPGSEQASSGHRGDDSTASNRLGSHHAHDHAGDKAAVEAHLKELNELTQSIARSTKEADRVSNMFTEARSELSYTVLREHFPLTWAACIASDLDSASSALHVDPDEAIAFGSEGRISLARFAWPIEFNSSLSHVVCFGRALVAELARSKKVNYTPEPVMSASAI